MRKRYHIQFKALLLLLLYSFSNSPSILFHHHELEIASSGKATSCEKAIHFSDKKSNCNLQIDVSKAPEKCSLCDNHTVSPHSSQTFFFRDFSKIKSADHSDLVKNYFFQINSSLSNRGPPEVSSFTI